MVLMLYVEEQSVLSILVESGTKYSIGANAKKAGYWTACNLDTSFLKTEGIENMSYIHETETQYFIEFSLPRYLSVIFYHVPCVMFPSFSYLD